MAHNRHPNTYQGSPPRDIPEESPLIDLSTGSNHYRTNNRNRAGLVRYFDLVSDFAIPNVLEQDQRVPPHHWNAGRRRPLEAWSLMPLWEPPAPYRYHNSLLISPGWPIPGQGRLPLDSPLRLTVLTYEDMVARRRNDFDITGYDGSNGYASTNCDTTGYNTTAYFDPRYIPTGYNIVDNSQHPHILGAPRSHLTQNASSFSPIQPTSFILYSSPLLDLNSDPLNTQTHQFHPQDQDEDDVNYVFERSTPLPGTDSRYHDTAAFDLDLDLFNHQTRCRNGLS